MERGVTKLLLLGVVGLSLLAALIFIGIKISNLSSNGISGQAVSEDTFVGDSALFSELNLAAKIFLIVQFLALFALAIYWIVKTQLAMKERAEVSNFEIITQPGRSKTEIDTLYTILQEKKKIRVSTISKAFDVNSDIAMEWCRILENGELAELDYPGFIGEPSIRLIEKTATLQPTRVLDKKQATSSQEEHPLGQTQEFLSTKDSDNTDAKKISRPVVDKKESAAVLTIINPSQDKKEDYKQIPIQAKEKKVLQPIKPQVQKSNLNERDKKWASEAINKGLTKNQAKALLKSIDSNKAEEILSYYDELKSGKKEVINAASR